MPAIEGITNPEELTEAKMICPHCYDVKMEDTTGPIGAGVVLCKACDRKYHYIRVRVAAFSTVKLREESRPTGTPCSACGSVV